MTEPVAFVSSTARHFAETVGTAIAGLAEEWSDEKKGSEGERVRGFLDALQSVHMATFTRQSYLSICDECSALGTDPVQEFLKLAKGIQARIPSSLGSVPTLEMSIHLRQRILGSEKIRTLTGRGVSLTAGRLSTNSLLIPGDWQSLSRVQVIALSLETQLGGLFMIIDPGSVGGLKILSREDKKNDIVASFPSTSSSTTSSSTNVAHSPSMSEIEIAPQIGGIIFVGESEKVNLALGKKYHGRSCDMTLQMASAHSNETEPEFFESEEIVNEAPNDEDDLTLPFDVSPPFVLFTLVLVLSVVSIWTTRR